MIKFNTREFKMESEPNNEEIVIKPRVEKCVAALETEVAPINVTLATSYQGQGLADAALPGPMCGERNNS